MNLKRILFGWAEGKFGRDDPGAETGGGPRPAAGNAPAAVPPCGPTLPARESAVGEETVIEALRTVYDPEIPVNIYDLGLIYGIRIEGGRVAIEMTLTAPGCPVAGEMPGMVRDAVESVAGVAAAEVELVWDPPWDPSRMSEAARLETGMF